MYQGKVVLMESPKPIGTRSSLHLLAYFHYLFIVNETGRTGTSICPVSVVFVTTEIHYDTLPLLPVMQQNVKEGVGDGGERKAGEGEPSLKIQPSYLSAGGTRLKFSMQRVVGPTRAISFQSTRG